MIDEATIKRIDEKYGTGDKKYFTCFETFDDLLNFARDIEQLARQEQREEEPALAPSALTGGLASALFTLVSEWEREAAFLSNHNDHKQDKAVGKTYAECAAKLRAAIGG